MGSLKPAVHWVKMILVLCDGGFGGDWGRPEEGCSSGIPAHSIIPHFIDCLKIVLKSTVIFSTFCKNS